MLEICASWGQNTFSSLSFAQEKVHFLPGVPHLAVYELNLHMESVVLEKDC